MVKKRQVISTKGKKIAVEQGIPQGKTIEIAVGVASPLLLAAVLAAIGKRFG